MPTRSGRPCLAPGCPAVVRGGYCPQHKRTNEQQRYRQVRTYERERGSAASRGYGARWRAQSKMFLRRHPLCVACVARGRTTAATVVDHVQPHRGDHAVFWDVTNWQPLCKACHDSKTAREVNARR